MVDGKKDEVGEKNPIDQLSTPRLGTPQVYLESKWNEKKKKLSIFKREISRVIIIIIITGIVTLYLMYKYIFQFLKIKKIYVVCIGPWIDRLIKPGGRGRLTCLTKVK